MPPAEQGARRVHLLWRQTHFPILNLTPGPSPFPATKIAPADSRAARMVATDELYSLECRWPVSFGRSGYPC